MYKHEPSKNTQKLDLLLKSIDQLRTLRRQLDRVLPSEIRATL